MLSSFPRGRSKWNQLVHLIARRPRAFSRLLFNISGIWKRIYLYCEFPSLFRGHFYLDFRLESRPYRAHTPAPRPEFNLVKRGHVGDRGDAGRAMKSAGRDVDYFCDHRDAPRRRKRLRQRSIRSIRRRL